MAEPARTRRVALTVLWLVTAALLIGAAREVYARTFLSRMIHQSISVSPDVPLTRKDPIYGERPVPGHFDVSISVPEAREPYHFSMDIDADGYRTTSLAPEHHAGQPEVWIFGCSFTWGYPLDNSDTYPWLVQDALPASRVRNFGVHGVGNLRALRQMRELLQEERADPPRVAVFGFASFHKARNIRGALAHEPGANALSSHILDYRDVLTPEALEAVTLPASITDPTAREETRVTFAIFEELSELCKRHDIQPLLAVQHTGGGFDPLIGFAQSRGFQIVPMEVDFRRAIYNVMPFDNHPSAEAHQIYAAKLLTALRPLLRDSER